MNKYLLLVVMLLLQACTNKPVGEFIENNDEIAKLQSHLNLEPIYGLEWSKDSLNFLVRTTGCTQRQHFKINTSGNVITILRKQNDYCRAMPSIERITIKIDLPEKWLLANPLAITPEYMRN